MPCARSAQACNVGEAMAVLVDVDRNRRRGLQARTVGVAGGQRLLAVVDAELRELRQRVERLVERPVLVDVDLQRRLGHFTHGTHSFHVETVARPELQLEAREIDGLGRTPCHVVRISEPDRPRRRRTFALQTEQLPDGQVDELALEIVQRSVDCGARSPFPGRQPVLDLVEGKRIVSQRLSVLLDVGKRGLGRFLIAVDGRSFPKTGDLPVTDLDLHHLLQRRWTPERSRMSRRARVERCER